MQQVERNYSIGRSRSDESDAVRRLLIDFAANEQKHYDHPQQTPAEIEAGIHAVSEHFVGENVVFCARDSADEVVGIAWCSLFDPGTGLEGELVELVVAPGWRGLGIATDLCKRVMTLFRERRVTFASVWTRNDNPAAMAAYRAAGFRATDQAVLTWLPLDD
jgi:ribosomal protein S18 acetylase RimI-like enzyme